MKIKILVLIGFVFLICALIVLIITPGAKGYEISIYTPYPWYFWVFLIASCAVGIFIVIHQAFAKTESKWWLSGLFLIFMANFIFYTLPFFRGYYSYDLVDTQGTLTYVRDIELTRHFTAQDFYPSFHILIANISSISGIAANVVTMFMPAFFSFVFILGIYLLSKTLNMKRISCLLAVALAAAPWMGEQEVVVPRVFALMLTPILIAMWLKTVQKKGSIYLIFLLVMLITFVTIHPVNGGYIVIVIFALLLATIFLYQKLREKNINLSAAGNYSNKGVGYLGFILLMFVALAWFAWYSSFYFFKGYIISMSTISLWGSSVSSSTGNIIATAGLTIKDVIILFLKNEAPNLLYLGVAGVATVYVLVKKPWKSIEQNGSAFILIPQVFLWGILAVAAYISPLQLGYWRFLGYAIFPAIIVIAWFLGLADSAFWKRTAYGGVLILMFIALVIGYYSVYPSPWQESSNSEEPYSLRCGLEWFIKYQNGVSPIDSFPIRIDRMAGAVTGYAGTTTNIQENFGEVIPVHLGYDMYATYGEEYPENHYIMIPQQAYFYYSERIPQYPSLWLWTPADLDKLHNDSTVNEIYSSDGFEIMFTNTHN